MAAVPLEPKVAITAPVEEYSARQLPAVRMLPLGRRVMAIQTLEARLTAPLVPNCAGVPLARYSARTAMLLLDADLPAMRILPLERTVRQLAGLQSKPEMDVTTLPDVPKL